MYYAECPYYQYTHVKKNMSKFRIYLNDAIEKEKC